jgi:molybdopterin converting factor small subunit
MVDNQEEENYLPGDATVRELLQSLVQRYGDSFRSMMLTPNWQLLPNTIIYLNGRDINEIDGLETKLADNSELSITVITYAIGGG